MITTITTQDKINILKREIAMRNKVYRTKIYFGEMTEQEADFQIKGMEAILEDYQSQGKPLKLFGEE